MWLGEVVSIAVCPPGKVKSMAAPHESQGNIPRFNKNISALLYFVKQKMVLLILILILS